MEYTSAACPNCGANMKIDSSMEKGFCTYCGSQVTLAPFMPILGKNLITTYNTKQYDMETFLQFM